MNVAEMRVDLKKKRPPKQQVVSFITNQYAALHAGIPGSTKENIRAQFALGNHYLYEGEVRDIIANNRDKAGFDAQEFIDLLKFCGCIKVGSTPSFGENLIRIDSPERAKEVAKHPEDAPKVEAIMKQMVELRKELKPLINGTCSIALKNVKSKSEKIDPDDETEKQKESEEQYADS